MMKRSLSRAAVLAGVALFAHGLFVVSEWADGWTTSEQFEALTTGYITILLMSLISLAALMDWKRRRSRGWALLWWRPTARAFGGAAIFSIAALINGLPLRLAHPIGLLGRYLLWNDSFQRLLIPVWSGRITFLLVTAGTAALLRRQVRRHGASPRIFAAPWWLARLFLLSGLLIALRAAWTALWIEGPDLLMGPLGYQAICGYVTIYWVRASSPFTWPDAGLVIHALDLFSAVVLILWIFQHVCWRLVGRYARTPVQSRPMSHT
jgi:hypothetical protein